MSVRHSLLAILQQGPCYGYQLRAEFDRRTGSTWPLNVGQIYNTLDRLERDGLVEKGDVDEHGHVYWRITDAGTAEVRDWLASPVLRPPGTRDQRADFHRRCPAMHGSGFVPAKNFSAVDVEPIESAFRCRPDRPLAEDGLYIRDAAYFLARLR